MKPNRWGPLTGALILLAGWGFVIICALVTGSRPFTGIGPTGRYGGQLLLLAIAMPLFALIGMAIAMAVAKHRDRDKKEKDAKKPADRQM